MENEKGGTVRYRRADYHPGTDEPWLVWFTKDQADPYWFTVEQGEAMGLTPPEPEPLVVTCNGHRVELSDDEARRQMQSLTEDYVAMEARAIAAERERDELRRELDAATEGTRRAAQALWGGEHWTPEWMGEQIAAALDEGVDRD